jgi:hypothetical protein
MPDFVKMTGNDGNDDPFDTDFLKALSSNPFGENVVPRESRGPARLAPDVTSTLRRMTHALKIVRPDHGVIAEGLDIQDEIDGGQSDILDLDLIESGSTQGELLNEGEVFTPEGIDDEEDS